MRWTSPLACQFNTMVVSRVVVRAFITGLFLPLLFKNIMASLRWPPNNHTAHVQELAMLEAIKFPKVGRAPGNSMASQAKMTTGIAESLVDNVG